MKSCKTGEVTKEGQHTRKKQKRGTAEVGIQTFMWHPPSESLILAYYKAEVYTLKKHSVGTMKIQTSNLTTL